MAFALISGARHSLSPPQEGGPLTTPQASLHATDRCFAPPLKGFRHWASTPGVSPRRRQSATGPPGSYPDRTPTGRRQRAYDRRSLTTLGPPVCWARETARLRSPMRQFVRQHVGLGPPEPAARRPGARRGTACPPCGSRQHGRTPRDRCRCRTPAASPLRAAGPPDRAAVPARASRTRRSPAATSVRCELCRPDPR